MPPNDLDPAGEKILERLDAVIASGDPEPLDFFSALSEFEARALEAVRAAGSPAELDALELHLLRQKGELNTVLRSVGKLPPALRKRVGGAANGVRTQVAAEIEARREALGPAAPKGPPFDVTLPGRRPFVGRPHVLAASDDLQMQQADAYTTAVVAFALGDLVAAPGFACLFKVVADQQRTAAVA